MFTSEIPSTWTTLTLEVHSVVFDGLNSNLEVICLTNISHAMGCVTWSDIHANLQLVHISLQNAQVAQQIPRIFPFLFKDKSGIVVEGYKMCSFIFVVAHENSYLPLMDAHINPAFKLNLAHTPHGSHTVFHLSMACK